MIDSVNGEIAPFGHILDNIIQTIYILGSVI